MNNSRTTHKLRSFYVLLFLALSGLGLGAWGLGMPSIKDQRPKTKDRTSFSPINTFVPFAAPLLQAVGCSGFSFTYARGFATDPATQARPISVVSGDFNKDGKLDLVAANLFANTISVLLGDGTGGFSLPTNLPVVADGKGSPAGLAVADFNSDNKLDLAVAIEYNPGRVFVMRGDGAGNFSVSNMLDAGVNTTTVAIGDFNDDSKPDLAAVNKGDVVLALAGNVSVFVNDGLGGFGTATNFSAGSTPVAIVTGNFDNDSSTDLAVANSASNNISILAGNGAGSFTAASNIPVGTNPSGIVAGQFNGDTRLDLAVTNTGSDNVSVLLANGSGGFGAATNYSSGITPFGIGTGDFDGNGKTDLAVANGFANQASVLLNDGSGGFGAPLASNVGSQPLSLAVGDFNGDTKADLAVANSSSNNISILLGKGNGTFGRTTFLFSDPQAIVTADFNKDGRLDLAVANFGGDKVTVFLADNTGGYNVPSEFNVRVKPLSMVAGDFNKDGKSDLAVANNGSASISILLGDGTGNFGTQTEFTAALQPRSLAMGDFNKDGNLDLITANEGASNLTLLLGAGDGTFGTPSIIVAGAKPVSVKVADLNGDGNQDFVAANLNSNFVSVLLGNGTGGFTAASNVNLPASSNGRAVTLGDLNKDQKLDLLVALNAASDIVVALGNGNGSFGTSSTITTTGANPTDIAIGDFDGDAKADVAVTNSSNDFLTIFPGKGDGTFLTPKDFGTGAGPVALDTGDLNNDQRLDIAVVNSSSNSLTLLLNSCANTPPSLTPAATLTRTQGGTATNATIATISDLETAVGNLVFSATPPTGVSLTNIQNTNGTITANVSADCDTPTGNKTVMLQVTDEKGLVTTSTITVTVTNNTAPVLGNYPALEVVLGLSRSFTPTAAPTDNGTITGITAVETAVGFTSMFSVNTTTGVLTVGGPSATGNYGVTLTATDNCGMQTIQNLSLIVVAPLFITSLDPNTKQAQSGDFTLTVNGSGFTANSKVRWNGTNRATTFVSATKLTAAILAADLNLNAAGTASVTVFDPAAGGFTSNTSQFAITAPNPVPAITSLSPATAVAGDAGFTLTINGSNFLNNSVVKYNGADRTTNYISATQVSIAVTAADLANPATAAITVVNPAPGGGTSNTVNLPINNPAPGAITLNPTSAIAGAASITLTVTGTGFRPDSIVRVNNDDRATTVVSATQVTTVLSAADLAVAGTLQIAVNTPPPGGGLSPAATFTVNNPAPVLTSLSPSAVLAGDAAFTLTINGSGFVNTSQVRVNGTNRGTTVVSATQLTIAVTAVEIADPGIIKIAVRNPTPGGGNSNELSLAINNPVPVLTSLDKTAAQVGSTATPLLLNGSAFRPNSVVRVNGTDRATTFVSASQLGITLTVADLATAGTLKLSVFTPTPGGGTTGELTFTINNPVPTIASLNPATALAGGAAFTLLLDGSGFVSSSVVRFNGVDRATTVLNSTQASVQVTAADIANPGTAKLTVFNPAPQGGLSNEVTLAINNPAPSTPTLSQSTLTAGAGATMLTLTGSGYRPNSLARVNGVDRVTTYVSATELKVNLLSSDVANGGTLKITVFTPEPGGGISPEATLTINNPAPTLTNINPNAAFKGDPAFTLTITGTNFVPNSVVRWNGANRTTTFVSATQLTAAIPATDLASDGNIAVTVFNPTPAGGTSTAATFIIKPLTGFEADVTLRPTGDNKVTIADWVQVGRFASGIDATTNSSEFQRADCAPLATNGDGKITIADWVQTGRFAVGLDPIVPAAGPSQPASLAESQALRARASAFEAAQGELTRIVRARAATFTRGDLNALLIELEGQGNENGLSLSLNFDPKQIMFSHVVAPAGWTVNVNKASQGRIGLMMVLSAGQVAQLGKQPIVTAYFAALGGTGAVTTEIGFDDQVFPCEIADVQATTLPRATYENARITITGRGITNVRAASYVGPELASDSIASAFGTELAGEVASASFLPLPTTLAGTTVNITDSKGMSKAAPLFFVSPSQVNYLIPAGLADGIASVTITNRADVVSRGSLLLNAAAPSLFSADASGKGWAAAEVVRVLSNGQQIGEPTVRYDPGENKFVAVPIDLGPERGKDSDRVFLTLYGTGIRQRAEVSHVKVKIGELFVPAAYAGPQSEFAGLDQINVLLPRNLLGRGEVSLEVIVAGQSSNTVKVQIR